MVQMALLIAPQRLLSERGWLYQAALIKTHRDRPRDRRRLPKAFGQRRAWLAVSHTATPRAPCRKPWEAVSMGLYQCSLVLYQRSLILTPFTAAIFAASQERVAPSCGPLQATRDAAGGKKRPARRVGPLGPPGAQGAFGRRLPDVAHRAAHRACPAGRVATMKGVNINDLWYYRSIAGRGV